MPLLPLLLALWAALPAWAGQVTDLRYFEDPTNALSLEEVLARPASDWVASPKTPHLGPSRSRFWFRFHLPETGVVHEVPGVAVMVEIPNSYLQKVELLEIEGNKVVRRSITGREVPLSQRDSGVLRTATNTFRVQAHRDPLTEYFISVDSRSPISLPLRILGAQEYAYKHWTYTLFLGIVFGCLAMAALLNGIISVTLRSRLYFYYCLFVAFISMAILAHEGIAIQLLWPESPWWAAREIFFFGGFTTIFYALFVREFLESPRVAPWLNRMMISIVIVSTVCMAWALLTLNQVAMLTEQFCVLLINLVVLAIAAKAFLRRVPSAKYFFFSSFGFNFSVLLVQLQEAGLIHLGGFIDHWVHIGVVWEVLFLGFALANRIRLVNQELSRQKAAVIHSEKMSALGRMAGEVAHEINNPLAVIHGNAVLIGKLSDPEVIRDCASRIEQMANRISKTVKGMRSVARDSRGDPFQKVSLSALLQDMTTLCGERVRNEQVKLSIPNEAEDLELLCRSSEICQVLVNLVNNALDAIADRPDREIAVEARKDGKLVNIAVTDNGPGVPSDIRGRILEPFFTTKEAGKGAGLGLSISRSIVEAHGGVLKLDESHPRTRFVFSVKAAEPTN